MFKGTVTSKSMEAATVLVLAALIFLTIVRKFGSEGGWHMATFYSASNPFFALQIAPACQLTPALPSQGGDPNVQVAG